MEQTEEFQEINPGIVIEQQQIEDIYKPRPGESAECVAKKQSLVAELNSLNARKIMSLKGLKTPPERILDYEDLMRRIGDAWSVKDNVFAKKIEEIRRSQSMRNQYDAGLRQLKRENDAVRLANICKKAIGEAMTQEVNGLARRVLIKKIKQEDGSMKLVYRAVYSADSASSALQTCLGNAPELARLSEVRIKNPEAYSGVALKLEKSVSSMKQIVQTMINRYASRDKKEVFICETIYLTKNTIRRLADLYSMDAPVKNYLLSMADRNKASLAKLVNEAYADLQKDKARWN